MPVPKISDYPYSGVFNKKKSTKKTNLDKPKELRLLSKTVEKSFKMIKNNNILALKLSKIPSDTSFTLGSVKFLLQNHQFLRIFWFRW